MIKGMIAGFFTKRGREKTWSENFSSTVSALRMGAKLADFCIFGYRKVAWFRREFLSVDMLITYVAIILMGLLFFVAFQI